MLSRTRLSCTLLRRFFCRDAVACEGAFIFFLFVLFSDLYTLICVCVRLPGLAFRCFSFDARGCRFVFLLQTKQLVRILLLTLRTGSSNHFRSTFRIFQFQKDLRPTTRRARYMTEDSLQRMLLCIHLIHELLESFYSYRKQLSNRFSDDAHSWTSS